MKHPLRLVAPLLVVLAVSCASTATQDGPRLMAEWEPARGTMIAYPFELPGELISDLGHEAELFVLVKDELRDEAARALTEVGLAEGQYELVPSGVGTPWTRDWGPHQVETSAGERALVDHIFLGYPWVPAECDVSHISYEFGEWSGEDAAVDALSAHLDLETVDLPAVATGGNLLTDGRGRAFCTEAQVVENMALVADGDEGHIDEARYRQLLERHLGVTDLVVLENTEPLGIQHIDCWMKVVDEETLLIKAAPEDHPEHAPLERNVERLRALATPSGGSYRILRIDCAPFATMDMSRWGGGEEEDLLPAYTNSLVLNGVVHVPLFDGPADEAALATFRQAFPDHEVRGYLHEDWKPFDALHCRARALHAAP